MAVMEVIEKTIVPKTGRVRLKMVETDIATSSKFLVVFPSGLSYKSLLPGNNFTDYILRELEADQQKDREALEQNFYPKVDMLVNRYKSWGVPNLYHWRHTWNYIGWADKYKGQNQNNTIVDASKATYSPLLADIAKSEVEIADFRNNGEDFLRLVVQHNLKEWSRSRDYISTMVETDFVFSVDWGEKFSNHWNILADSHGLRDILIGFSNTNGDFIITLGDIASKIPFGETAVLHVDHMSTIDWGNWHSCKYEFTNTKIVDNSADSYADGVLTVRGYNSDTGGWQAGIHYTGKTKKKTKPASHFEYSASYLVKPLRVSWFNGKTFV